MRAKKQDALRLFRKTDDCPVRPNLPGRSRTCGRSKTRHRGRKIFGVTKLCKLINNFTAAKTGPCVCEVSKLLRYDPKALPGI